MIRHGDRLLILKTFNYHQQFHRIAAGEGPAEPEWYTVDRVKGQHFWRSDLAAYWTVTLTRDSDGARLRLRVGRFTPDESDRKDELRGMIIRRVGVRPAHGRWD